MGHFYTIINMDSANGEEDTEQTSKDLIDLGITKEELVKMTSKDLNRLLKLKGIPDSRRREIRKNRRSSKIIDENRKNPNQTSNVSEDSGDLRSQIEELKRLGHLQKLRIEEEIRRSFELKQKLEALEDDKKENSNNKRRNN